MEKLNKSAGQSMDIVADNIAKLKELFPEILAENKIDFKALQALLGEEIETEDERYSFNWHGKVQARRLAQSPSTGTLRPCKEESVNWDSTQNLFVEGDNLEVLKLLQKSYHKQVKMIYIDPPYNTGNDFVYPDDFKDNIQNYLEITGQVEGGKKTSSNTEASGRFHTDWLNMIYPRLKLGRSLLRDDGVVFISIDEKEYSSLRLICCEIYGEENIVGTIIWKNSTDNNPTNVATEHEYILVVAKKKNSIEKEWKSAVSDVKDVLVNIGHTLTSKFTGNDLSKAYEEWYKQHKSELWPLYSYKYIDSGGVYTGSQSVHNPGREGYRYDLLHPVTKKPCKQPLMGYRFPRETMDELLASGRILFGENESKIIELKVYASEFKEKLSSLLELDGRLGAYDLKEDFPSEGKVFTNPKPVRLFEAFLPFLLKEDGDCILDFFAGSGSTGKAVWKLNLKDSIRRKFILVQLPEPLDEKNSEQKAAVQLCSSLGVPHNIAEITKERLRRACKLITEENGNSNFDTGFRTFRLDSSNLKPWDADFDSLSQDLADATDVIKADRKPEDVLFEILLKYGLDLTLPIDTHTIASKTVFEVGAGALIVCLDDGVTETVAEGIGKLKEQLDPEVMRVVFKDSSFASDAAKVNAVQVLKQYGIDDVKSI